MNVDVARVQVRVPSSTQNIRVASLQVAVPSAPPAVNVTQILVAVPAPGTGLIRTYRRALDGTVWEWVDPRA